MKTIYQTIDGRTFFSKQQASDHEAYLEKEKKEIIEKYKTAIKGELGELLAKANILLDGLDDVPRAADLKDSIDYFFSGVADMERQKDRDYYNSDC